MKTILVPTDFSKCADNAMNYALEIASRLGMSVTALYVVYPNEGVDNNVYDAFFVDDYVKQRLKGMKIWAKKFARRNPRFKDVEIKLDCQIGFPVSAIGQKAQDVDVNLVVMGTTGATGLRGVLLGSVAGGVVNSCKKPVFVIPPKAVFHENARYAFATDFKMPVSKSSLQTMRELLYLQQTGLDIIHVMDKPDAKPDRDKEKALSEKLGTIPHSFHYIHDENVVRAIHNFLESTECNGLVAVAHEHSLLRRLFAKSVSKALAHQTRVPLLVLHDV
jgi:nucleotide-binding universal stress UspA family protein